MLAVTSCAHPGSWLGILTDKDQQGTFLWLEFRKLVAFKALVVTAAFFPYQINDIFSSVLYF